jgi:hypothetical protein
MHPVEKSGLKKFPEKRGPEQVGNGFHPEKEWHSCINI